MLAQTKPANLPVYRNAQAWVGRDMSTRTDWIHTFSAAELDEIEAAVHTADTSGRDLLEMSSGHLPLPLLAPSLQALRHELLHGRGFHLFRGLPVARWTPRQCAIAFWALGLHLGEPVSQNGKGHVLGHVTNLGLNYADPEVRGYQTNARLPYHTDSSDLVGLLCLRTSQAGGLSSLVSSTTLWNVLVDRHPEHARTLMSAFPRTRWGEIPAQKQKWSSGPIFVPGDQRVFASYVRSAITKGQAMPEVPRVTAEMTQALDQLDALAADPDLHLDMTLEPGDLQLVSNWSIFHSRTAYQDWPEPERRRHLLRLWLACDDGPALPESLTGRLGLTARGRPDGINVPGVPFVAPLVPA